MIHVIRSGIFEVNSLIVEIGQKKVFVVDPAGCSLSKDENIITNYLKTKKLDCVGIILTHCHFDHITGIFPIKQNFPNAQIAIHEAEFKELQNLPGKINLSVLNYFGYSELLKELKRQPSAEKSLKDGEIYFGWKIIHTPGHSPGSICLYNEKENILISGDTLFENGGYGRTDFEGGDEIQIIKSLKLLNEKIPKGTLVYPGHDGFGFKF